MAEMNVWQSECLPLTIQNMPMPKSMDYKDKTSNLKELFDPTNQDH